MIDTSVASTYFNRVILMTHDLPAPDAKQRLLLAAEEVFAEKGYASATIREITERAEANIAAINYHFGDKERLYIETVRFAHTCAAKGLPLPLPPEGTPPVEKLTAFIREMATRMTQPTRPSSLRLMMREMSQPTAAAHAIITEFIQPMAFGLRAIVRDLLPTAPDTRVLMIGFSIIGQILFYRQNRQVADLIFGKEPVDAISTEMIAEHVTRFTIAALGHGEPIREAAP
jgi:TetR/AcrR family transcriptional regulator, regulator of cefoperazone and chloramphenicol sensitivity